ncbi:MAG: GTPase HflX [Marinilabiliaceae bacterium]|nr:GTPase HflX [Marinilabiliaceae bacterium]
MISTEKIAEKIVLIAVRTPDLSENQIKEHLDELAFLAHTAGGIPIKRFTQNLSMPDGRTYVGSGKLEEIKDFLKFNEDVSCIIFDDELSPAQLRNIENSLKIRILDRTTLILDIFAARARTAYAKTQVELAQLQYLLPRLTRMWTHLERQRGGIGMRGPGEKEIETDRRIIRDKISKLKDDLEKIDKQMITQRKNRVQLTRVALVGYTNVGKSTLMNVLSKSELFAENKLFATLDVTIRKMVIENLPFLITDTVGFIRKLPHHLIESFKSTLDEVREADILLHIVDISHPNFENQIETVSKTLLDIDNREKRTILVFNKIDDFSYTPKEEDDLTPATKENLSLDDLKKTWMAQTKPTVFISAKEKTNIEELRQILYDEVLKMNKTKYISSK